MNLVGHYEGKKTCVLFLKIYRDGAVWIWRTQFFPVSFRHLVVGLDEERITRSNFGCSCPR